METLRKNYTSALVINDKGKMLLQLKNDSYPFWPNCLATFGGGINDFEAPRACMMRAFGIETLVKLKNFVYFCEQDFSDESKFGNKIYREGRIYYFSARISENDAGKIETPEGRGHGFFSEEELRKKNELGQIIPYQHEVIEKFLDSLK